MPVGVIHYDAFLSFDVLNFFDDRIGFIGNLLVEFAPVVVILVNAFASFVRLVHIFREQQFDGLASVHHPSRGIDAWSDLKDDVADRYLLAGQSADVDDASQSEARVVIELAQPVVSEDAIFARDRYDIGRDTDGRQFE